MGACLAKDEASQPTRDEGPRQTMLPYNYQEILKDADAVVDRTSPEMMLPYNYQEILKDADRVVDRTPPEKLFEHLCYGVFLNQRKKKYWIDKNSTNCFMLYAKVLSVVWGDDSRYWHWPLTEESGDVSVVAAELLDVCYLEVGCKKFNTKNLTPEILYEIVFVVMLNEDAYGWEKPINLSMTLPNGNRVERQEDMRTQPRRKWVEIRAGELKTSRENTGEMEISGELKTSRENIGEMEISLYEHGGHWKRGLVIKGVLIRPKKHLN